MPSCGDSALISQLDLLSALIPIQRMAALGDPG